MADTRNPQSSSEDTFPMSHRTGCWDNVNPQKSSPLFNRIPPEIRNLIFKFALAEVTAPALDRQIRHDFFARDDHEALDDEPEMEGGPPSPAADQGEHESSVQTPDVENGPAPAVQAPPASTLLHLREMKLSWDWFRPGFEGQRKIHTSLLRSCRRIYLETYLLPSQGSKIFYNDRGPPWCPRSPRKYVSGLAPAAARHIRNLRIFSQMRFLEGELMDMVTGVFGADAYFRRLGSLPMHMIQPQIVPPLLVPQFFHQGHLPCGPLPQLAYPPGCAGPRIWQALQETPSRYLSEVYRIRSWRVTEHLTSLRIYLRRTDWWNWEHNAPLVINPFKPAGSRSSTVAHMYHSMSRSAELDNRLDQRQRSSTPSAIPDWRCWGLLFLRMPRLQKLTIDFETSEDKKAEMEMIVDWAHRRWRFPALRRLSGSERDPYTFSHLESCHKDISPVNLSPWMQDMDVLSAEDEPVQKTSWRGLPHHFSGKCHGCGATWSAQDVTPGCLECTKKDRLLALNKGPQLLVWTVNWKRKVCTRDPEADGNVGGEFSQERGDQTQTGTARDERTRHLRELHELMRRGVMF